LIVSKIEKQNKFRTYFAGKKETRRRYDNCAIAAFHRKLDRHCLREMNEELKRPA
jgi:hypothetical protein